MRCKEDFNPIFWYFRPRHYTNSAKQQNHNDEWTRVVNNDKHYNCEGRTSERHQLLHADVLPMRMLHEAPLEQYRALRHARVHYKHGQVLTLFVLSGDSLLEKVSLQRLLFFPKYLPTVGCN